LKQLIGLPRPYWISTKVVALAAEQSFGLPSGHAQTAAALWGSLAAGLGKSWAYLAAGVLIFLISLSRVALGVHFGSDVLAGWLVGGLLLLTALRAEASLLAYLNRRSLGGRLVIALLGGLALAAIQLAVMAAVSGRGIPTSWIEMAQGAAHQADAPHPYDPSGAFTAAGTFFGLAAGAILLFDWGKFNPAGRPLSLLGRYVIGLAGVLGLYLGLSLLFPGGDDAVGLAFRFVRYSLIGVWVAYLAPRLFVRLRLA
jgi:hypothetical protein